MFQKFIKDVENCIPPEKEDWKDLDITAENLPWREGFVACVLLRLESNNVIRNVDDKGTNRRKTSKIGFYNILGNGDWESRGPSVPGMSAVEMFNATKELTSTKSGLLSSVKKWFKKSSSKVAPAIALPNTETIFEDYRNAKFVGDLTQQAMANEFSYKCWTGDLVACSCVRFIKPKDGEPFLLFYRGRSSQSPEAIFLHFAKTHKPTQCSLVSKTWETEAKGQRGANSQVISDADKRKSTQMKKIMYWLNEWCNPKNAKKLKTPKGFNPDQIRKELGLDQLTDVGDDDEEEPDDA